MRNGILISVLEIWAIYYFIGQQIVKTSCEVKNRRERCLADGGEKLGQ
jgi:hypothetical protein